MAANSNGLKESLVPPWLGSEPIVIMKKWIGACGFTNASPGQFSIGREFDEVIRKIKSGVEGRLPNRPCTPKKLFTIVFRLNASPKH